VALVVYVVPNPPAFVQNLTNEMRITARSIGPFLDPNYFGTFLATAAVLFMASYPMARSRAIRIASIALVVVLVAALATTLSRGAFVALLAGVLALTLTISRRWAVATLLTSVVIVILVYPSFAEYRFGEARSSAIEALDESGRQYAAAAGIRIFESSPIFGVGLAHYPEATVRIGELPAPIESHNWYVNVLAEQGIVGIVLWLGLILSVLRAVWVRGGIARRVGIGVLAAAVTGAISLQTPASFQTSALTAIALTMAMVGRWPTSREAHSSVGKGLPWPRRR
jgi:O-antigen ligase